ncbi:MAG: bifunctional DNA primase/polymerase [Pseudonocardiaceae bacterium]
MSDHTGAASRLLIAPLLPGIPGLAWTEIRAAAVDLARHGWPVLPGTYRLAEHGAWLGKRGAAGLEPAAPLWQLATTTDPEVALEWWTRRPYSVLLACGTGVNAVEVPATHGQRALARLLPSERSPVAATPFSSWLFFVRGNGEPLRPELAANAHGQLHAAGAWLPLPPTAREGVPYRWKVPPSGVGWVLSASANVQRVLVESLARPASGTRPNLA